MRFIKDHEGEIDDQGGPATSYLNCRFSVLTPFLSRYAEVAAGVVEVGCSKSK